MKRNFQLEVSRFNNIKTKQYDKNHFLFIGICYLLIKIHTIAGFTSLLIIYFLKFSDSDSLFKRKLFGQYK